MIQVNYDSIRRSIQGLNNNNTLRPGNSKINNYISEINNIWNDNILYFVLFN